MVMPDLKEARKRSKDPIEFKYFDLEEKYKDIAIGKKAYVKTYGCQMNEHDSENIKALVKYMGYELSLNMEDADLIILNTCSIRENAHNKVFGMLGRIKHLKQEKQDLIVGLMGCMSQEEVVTSLIKDRYQWLDFVLGTHRLEALNTIIATSLKKHELKIDAPSCEGVVLENLPVVRTSPYKAYVNIMYGCDKFCTYCIVPYTRGKQRSRKKEDILKEVETLKKEHYQEVTLLGQNVNAYGKDLYSSYTLAELLEDVAKTNIPRVRFITSHPWDFTDKMIDIIAKYDNVMPYVHLPIQSGSSDILRKMGRRYTKEEYLQLFEKIKAKVPNVAITTDIIVGFPNESDEDFQETLDVVRKCKFDLAYTFIFSKRVGTPAYKMEDGISLEVKEKRLAELNKLINQYAKEANEKLIGQKVKVLVEGLSEKDENILMGYTDTNKLVNVIGPKKIIGQIVDVKITDAKTWSLDGEYLK